MIKPEWNGNHSEHSFMTNGKWSIVMFIPNSEWEDLIKK